MKSVSQGSPDCSMMSLFPAYYRPSQKTRLGQLTAVAGRVLHHASWVYPDLTAFKKDLSAVISRVEQIDGTTGTHKDK